MYNIAIKISVNNGRNSMETDDDPECYAELESVEEVQELAPVPKTHLKCRSTITNVVKYQTGKEDCEVKRPMIPDDMVSWSVDWPAYEEIRIYYTAPVVLKKPVWADPEPPIQAKWNEIDNNIDRRSHHGRYKIENGLPVNPVGRTGLSGRGLLGKWGPNHAADPIVTRWLRGPSGQVLIDSVSNKPILQFVAIKRVDTGEWAIPGGMCDPGEKVSQTLKREFMEEALNSGEMSTEEKNLYKQRLSEFFSKGIEIYKGYVDDPRNTDNAWMETIAVNFHDEDNTVFKDIVLQAGDDAKHVQWMRVANDLQLYASHKEFVKAVAMRLNAHW